MSGLVGQEREQIIVKRCLINTQVLTNVLWLEYPTAGMIQLGPTPGIRLDEAYMRAPDNRRQSDRIRLRTSQSLGLYPFDSSIEPLINR